MRNILTPVILLTLAPLFAGCGGNGSTPLGGSLSGVDSASSIAVGVASGVTTQASGQAVSSNMRKTFLQRLQEAMSPISTAWASGSCPTYASPGTAACAGQTITLPYAECSFPGFSAIWNGGQNLSFGGTATCGSTALPIQNNGDQLFRTFIGTIPGSNPTTRSNGGELISLDTTTASGYSTPVSGGFEIDGIGGSQNITVTGVHLVGPSWDFTVSTAAGMPLNVGSPGVTPVILTGALVVQHNLLRYTGTTTFNNVQYSGNSCFPVSGSVGTTFSGSLNGSESMVFNGDGTATLTESNGNTSTFTMVHCF